MTVLWQSCTSRGAHPLILYCPSVNIGRMATWVAITWENEHLLFLSASTSGRAITFEHAAALDEPKKLGELIAKHRLAKAETIVVLNRSDVEVRPMVFPPVPLEELPDLIKFQASKEFNHYEPNAPVDFFVTNKLENVSRSTLFPAVKISEGEAVSGGAPKHVLASTLRLNTFQKIKTFCDEHNLTLRHIVLRPCAASALWRLSGNALPHRSTLLVELDKFEASQTVVFQGEPVFMRSPKIIRPQDVSVPDFAARILAELKRTRIAVRNEIQGINIDEIVLCGSGGTFNALAEQLNKGLDVHVRLFDPLKGLTVKTKDVDGQYAALFGTIQQVARKEPLRIDFYNPKKRTEDTSKRNMLTGTAAVVLLLVVGLFGYTFYSRMTLENDVKKLQSQFNALQKDSGPLADQKKQLDEIDKWLVDDVNWFEQLVWLSQKALSSQNMMIRDLKFQSPTSSGNIEFSVLLLNQSLASQMVTNFRDTTHTPQLGQQGPNTEPRRYTFRSGMNIRLSKDAGTSVRTQPPALETSAIPTLPSETPPTEPP